MAGLAHSTDEKAAVRAQCARVWCLLDDCRRTIAMRPRPKSVDADKWRASRAKRKSASSTLPDEFKHAA